MAYSKDIVEILIGCATYSAYNSSAVMKSYNKKKAKEKARQSVERLQSKTLYIINGYITDTKPTIE